MSPVVVAALSCAKMTATDLLDRMTAGAGRLVLGSDPIADAGLLAVVPKWSSVDRTGSSIDFCTPRLRTGIKYEYCEAHTLPFLKLRGVALPETIISSLPGRRLTTVIDGLFEAIRLVDPVIETARSSSEAEYFEIDLVFAMDWVTVPVTRHIQPSGNEQSPSRVR